MDKATPQTAAIELVPVLYADPCSSGMNGHPWESAVDCISPHRGLGLCGQGADNRSARPDIEQRFPSSLNSYYINIMMS